MITIRLPEDEEARLKRISTAENTSKSEIVKRALRSYFNDYFQKATPYDLGKDLFGKYGSGSGNLARDYKKIIKEKLNAKSSH